MFGVLNKRKYKKPLPTPTHTPGPLSKITNKNGLRESYAYHDRDIDILSRCLLNRDMATGKINATRFNTGNPNIAIQDPTRIFTNISRVKNQTIIELPAISAADTSPPGPRIVEQLKNLQTLRDENRVTKAAKKFPTDDQLYPIKILAPYKLQNSWHWNTLEIIINQDGSAHCKRYNTDGKSYPVQIEIFNNIYSALTSEFAQGKPPICTSLTNQTGEQTEYSFNMQSRVNCGLASSLIMHDLRRGVKDYDETNGSLSDAKLRERAYQIVQNYGQESDHNNFCKEINEDNFVTNQKALEANNPDVAIKEEIRDKLNQIILSKEQIEIIKECQQKNDNSIALEILRKPENQLHLTQILPILFDGVDTTTNPEDYKIKDQALNALREIELEEKQIADTLLTCNNLSNEQINILEKFKHLINCDKEQEAVKYLKDNKNLLGAVICSQLLEGENINPKAIDAVQSIDFTSQINEYFENATDSLHAFLKEHNGKEIDEKEMAQFIDALSQSVSQTDPEIQKLFTSIAKNIVEEYKEKQPATPPPPTKTLAIHELTKTEDKIINEYVTSGKPTQDTKTFAQDLQKFQDEESNLDQFLRPRTYSGIGASTHHEYNKEKKQFEFTIKELFAGGLAESWGLKKGFKIVYKSDEKSTDSLMTAVASIRQLATLTFEGPKTSQEEILISNLEKNLSIVDKDDKQTNLADVILNTTPKTKNILIHEKKTFNNPKNFIQQIQETQKRIVENSQPNPSPPPPKTRPKSPGATKTSPTHSHSK